MVRLSYEWRTHEKKYAHTLEQFHIYVFFLGGVYGISTFVGYLMPNPFL